MKRAKEVIFRVYGLGKYVKSNYGRYGIKEYSIGAVVNLYNG